MTQRTIGGWAIGGRLGQGGNSEVWLATKDGTECAIKLLNETRVQSESYRRFADEVGVLRSLGQHPGVLPIIDAYLPGKPSKSDRAWLVMPKAIGIRKALGERPKIDQVVEAVGTIAGTLAALAEMQICHRDIKPENLYSYQGSWVIGDFGLADFPGKDDVTEEGRALGPRFYIAPEMVRDPMNASGFPGDVWSLAKTLWVLATGQNYPPPHPQPANDPQDSLSAHINHPRVRYLDNLIERCTNKEPSQRPTMGGVADELKAWLATAEQPAIAVDASEAADRIRRLSVRFVEHNDRMDRCRKEAKVLTDQLLIDLKGIAEVMKNTGLQYNEPQDNGGNLLKLSGLGKTQQGARGATVSMYIHGKETHLYECGLMIQVIDERKHRLYAGHHIRTNPSDTGRVVWSVTREVESGSSEEQRALQELVKGLYDNLPLGMGQFAQMMEGG